jgi:hypothetical protein
MANDALALSGIDVGLPQEAAEYDAVYAAVTATERGRWFLTEFASRNRHADTESLTAAISRIEAAVRADAPARQAAHSSDIGGAADRLADIAMGLRERGADTMLCDALDAAVRELSGVGASGAENHDVKDDATIPDQSAAIGVDTAAPESAPPPLDASGAIVAESAPHSDSFDLPLQDSEKFAEAAAALAASLHALGEEAKPADEPQGAHSVAVIPEHDYEAGVAPSSQPAKSTVHAPRWHIEAPDFVFHQQRAANEPAIDFADGGSQPHALLPGPQLLPSPNEDPADLFEPVSKRVVALPPSAPPTSAAKPAPGALTSAASAPAPAARATDIPPARSPTGPTVRPLPRPAPVNPLAALRALTEEELIALFG